MNNFQILISLPLFAMAFLSFTVLLTLAKCRFKAAKARELDAKFYKLYRGDGEPDYIRQISRNFTNLFETPVLFFVAIILTIVLKIESTPLLYIAWAYVVLRHLHSYVHCSTNKVINRFRIFVLSVVVLIAYWVTLFINVIGQL